MRNKNILKLCREDGQSVAEYAILFVAVVAILFVAINGPVKSSLSSTFDGVIDAIGDSVNALIP